MAAEVQSMEGVWRRFGVNRDDPLSATDPSYAGPLAKDFVFDLPTSPEDSARLAAAASYRCTSSCTSRHLCTPAHKHQHCASRQHCMWVSTMVWCTLQERNHRLAVSFCQQYYAGCNAEQQPSPCPDLQSFAGHGQMASAFNACTGL